MPETPLPSRAVAILGGSDLEPPYENVVWNCPLCGKFTSARLGPHSECEEIMDWEELDNLRRSTY